MPDLSGVIGSVNTGVVMAGDKHLQEKGITKIICPAAGSASMTQWLDKPAKDDKPAVPGPKQLSIFRFAAHDGIQAAMVVEEAINRKLTKVAHLRRRHQLRRVGPRRHARPDQEAGEQARGGHRSRSGPSATRT